MVKLVISILFSAANNVWVLRHPIDLYKQTSQEKVKRKAIKRTNLYNCSRNSLKILIEMCDW